MARVWGANWVGALLAAILIGGGGAQLGRLWAGHVSFLLAAPYYPFALAFIRLSLDRRSFPAMLAAGASLGLAILAGGGWVALNLWLLAATVAVLLTFSRWRESLATRRAALQTLALLAMLPVAGVLISAAKLLPMLAYLPYSSRDTVEYGFAIHRSALTTPGDFLSVLTSRSIDRLNQAGDGAYLWHEFTAYVGAIPLLLAIMAIVSRRRRSTWILLGVAILFAVFAYGPGVGAGIDLYRVLFELVPGYENVRIPGRMLGGVWLPVALLAALGLSSLTRRAALVPIGLLLVGFVAIDLHGLARSWVQPGELDEYRVYASDNPGELVAGVLSLDVIGRGGSDPLSVTLELGNYGNTIWLPADSGQPGGVVATLGYLGTEIATEIPLATLVELRESIRLSGTVPTPPPGGALLMLGMKAHGVRSFDRHRPEPLTLALAWTNADDGLVIQDRDPRSRLLPPLLDSWFPFVADLENRAGRFMVSRYDIFNEADALRHDVEIVSGWDPGHLQHFTNFLGTSMLFTVPVDPTSQNILAILNTRYVYPHLGPEYSFAGGPDFVPVSGLPFTVYELTTTRPRAFLAPSAILLFTPARPDESAIQLRRLVTDPGFHPLTMTVIVIGPGGPTEPSITDLAGINPVAVAVVNPDSLDSRQSANLAAITADKPAIDISGGARGEDPKVWSALLASLPPAVHVGAEVELVSHSPDRAVITVNNPSVNTLVLDLATVWALGWKATVGGVPGSIVLAAAAVIGVPIPPGAHEVRIEYHAPGLLPGVILTICATMVVVGAGVFSWRRRGPRFAAGVHSQEI